MTEKFLSYSGVELLWHKIKLLTDKKIESIKAKNNSISVEDKNNVSVNVSKSEGNLLSLEQDGLYSSRPVLKKLTFGAREEFVYDGTKDITVPVYEGEYDINN